MTEEEFQEKKSVLIGCILDGKPVSRGDFEAEIPEVRDRDRIFFDVASDILNEKYSLDREFVQEKFGNFIKIFPEDRQENFFSFVNDKRNKLSGHREKFADKKQLLDKLFFRIVNYKSQVTTNEAHGASGSQLFHNSNQLGS